MPGRGVAAEVGGVPGGHLTGAGAVVWQLLQALEQPGERVPEPVGGLDQVVLRSDVQRGAEGEVDPTVTGEVDRGHGVTDGEQPLAAPDRDGTTGAPVARARCSRPGINGRTVNE